MEHKKTEKTIFYRSLCVLSLSCLCVWGVSVLFAQTGDPSVEASPPAADVSDDRPSPVDAIADTPSPADPNQPAESQSSAPKPEDETDNLMFPDSQDMVELFELFGRLFTDQLISETGMVDYATLRRKRIDLIQATAQLEKIHPAVVMSLEPKARMAFWINTYNTCALKLVIDNYPIQPKWYMFLYPANSVMQIPGAWDKVFFRIMGLEYNLKEIRNNLLLDRFQDPRICFVLNDIARGGAMVRNEPILPDRLDEQLNDQVRRFLKSSHGFRLDTATKTIHLSNVFVMNKNVFLTSEYAEILRFRTRKSDERAWLNFLLSHLPEQDAAWLEANGNDVVIRFIEFDWQLNEK